MTRKEAIKQLEWLREYNQELCIRDTEAIEFAVETIKELEYIFSHTE